MAKGIPSDVEVYSPKTDTTYSNWDALVAAEANGWLATAILRERAPKGMLFTYSVGPFPTKREAENARVKMRNKHRREDRDGHAGSDLLTTNVKPAWKEIQ